MEKGVEEKNPRPTFSCGSDKRLAKTEEGCTSFVNIYIYIYYRDERAAYWGRLGLWSPLPLNQKKKELEHCLYLYMYIIEQPIGHLFLRKQTLYIYTPFFIISSFFFQTSVITFFPNQNPNVTNHFYYFTFSLSKLFFFIVACTWHKGYYQWWCWLCYSSYTESSTIQRYSGIYRHVTKGCRVCMYVCMYKFHTQTQTQARTHARTHAHWAESCCAWRRCPNEPRVTIDRVFILYSMLTRKRSLVKSGHSQA